ncbi:hypothetical protein Rhe02_54880 [Rhizocola hellebori]|uniref:Uncharacterized protein n=1 Tax=Rhizocola hellebori TaxID=1392758 RepID=A0A8J3VIU2_9ACTN|nr:hypothetical protein [Rhizocola hellebori]GIH07421.1 hypothetical protein Rhe02_54880 [Rhizocola hellebori]
MGIGDAYATLEELQDRLGGVQSGADDDKMEAALLVAARGIEKVCRRQFNRSTVATARLYYPQRSGLLVVDDFHTTTGLIVAIDTGDDATYETTLTTADYQVEPLNGIVDGEEGWPYWRIRLMRSATPIPRRSLRAPAQVTAQPGWTAVPEPIKEANRAVAEEVFKLKDAPWGVAGAGEWGTIRVRENPMVMAMIARYRRDPVLVA